MPEVQSDDRPALPPVDDTQRVSPRAVGTRRLARLDGFKFTAPVTIADLTAARDLLRGDAPDAELEVCCHTGSTVIVDVRWPDQRMHREYDVPGSTNTSVIARLAATGIVTV